MPDGRVYSGGWQNDLQHGEGVITTPNGKQKRGLWENGIKIRWLNKNPVQMDTSNTSMFSASVADNYNFSSAIKMNGLKDNNSDTTPKSQPQPKSYFKSSKRSSGVRESGHKKLKQAKTTNSNYLTMPLDQASHRPASESPPKYKKKNLKILT